MRRAHVRPCILGVLARTTNNRVLRVRVRDPPLELGNDDRVREVAVHARKLVLRCAQCVQVLLRLVGEAAEGRAGAADAARVEADLSE